MEVNSGIPPDRPDHMQEGIDIMICTYNRSAYLRTCIDSLLPQLVWPHTRLTILDNNSSDDTGVWTQALALSRPDVQYERVLQQGVSYVRNRAMEIATRTNILFLDDECVVPDGFIQAALDLLQSRVVWDVIGGPYYALYPDTPPRKDPEDEFSFSMPYPSMTTIKDGFVRGGCMMIRTNTLRLLGGFDTSLGMKGHTIRYAEEIELQFRMRRQGYRIAYAPDLYVYHAVRPEKQTLSWKLYASYARRRDKRLFDPLPVWPAMIQVLRTTIGRMIWGPVHVVRWVVQPAYTWRACVLDILCPWLFRWGDLIGSLTSGSRKHAGSD